MCLKLSQNTPLGCCVQHLAPTLMSDKSSSNFLTAIHDKELMIGKLPLLVLNLNSCPGFAWFYESLLRHQNDQKGVVVLQKYKQ